MDWIGKTKGLLSMGAKEVFVVAIIAWVLLLLPDRLAETMGMANLRAKYPVIGSGALDRLAGSIAPL